MGDSQIRLSYSVIPIVYDRRRLGPWRYRSTMSPSAERERYYDPSFCPFAARNKHLLRHHVKCEERWRGAIDVDCRGTFLPRGSLVASLSSLVLQPLLSSRSLPS